MGGRVNDVGKPPRSRVRERTSRRKCRRKGARADGSGTARGVTGSEVSGSRGAWHGRLARDRRDGRSSFWAIALVAARSVALRCPDIAVNAGQPRRFIADRKVRDERTLRICGDGDEPKLT